MFKSSELFLKHSLTVPPSIVQVRRAIQQMLFQGKDFSWIRHIIIAIVLLTSINLLVIFAPSILGIFGLIGEFLHLVERIFSFWSQYPLSISPSIFFS